MRHKAPGVAFLKCQLQLALQQEFRIIHAVAHLQVVFQRHVLDCSGIGLAFGLEGSEGLRQVGVCIQLSCQCDAIFKCAIHALAVEGHHGVGRVTHQHGLAVDMPAIQVQGSQQAGRIVLPVLFQFGYERNGIGKITLEQRLCVCPGFHRGKAGVAFVGQEQGDGEGLFIVG